MAKILPIRCKTLSNQWISYIVEMVPLRRSINKIIIQKIKRRRDRSLFHKIIWYTSIVKFHVKYFILIGWETFDKNQYHRFAESWIVMELGNVWYNLTTGGIPNKYRLRRIYMRTVHHIFWLTQGCFSFTSFRRQRRRQTRQCLFASRRALSFNGNTGNAAWRYRFCRFNGKRLKSISSIRWIMNRDGTWQGWYNLTTGGIPKKYRMRRINTRTIHHRFWQAQTNIIDALIHESWRI